VPAASFALSPPNACACRDLWSRELQQRYGHHWLPSVLWMQEGNTPNGTISSWSNDAYLTADLEAIRKERIAMFRALRRQRKGSSTARPWSHARLRIPGDDSKHSGAVTEDGEVFEAPPLYEESVAQNDEREITPISLFVRAGPPQILDDGSGDGDDDDSGDDDDDESQ
jgi:hypothetical protein